MANEDDFHKMDPVVREVSISKVPYSVLQQLCKDMDPDEGWRELACAFGYTMQEVALFGLEAHRYNGSPTNKLLWNLCTRNTNIGDLYDRLEKCNHLRDMRTLESANNLLLDIIRKEQEKKRKKEEKKVEKSVRSNGFSLHSGMSSNTDNLQSSKTVPVSDSQMEDVNFFRPHTPKKQTVVHERKHYDDKIIPGQNNGSRSESLLPQENADESLQAKFGNMLVTNPKEKEVYESLKKTTAQSSLEVAIAMIGTHFFTYEQLSQATNSFSLDMKLGEGAFGQVFLGNCHNTKCAIKRLFEKLEANDTAEGPSAHLATELTTLMRYRHENLVSLYGYALDGEAVCLVYQFLPHGSLEDRIQCRNNSIPLTWEQRVSICRGAACGLQYLHTLEKKPLIHGDMKSPNVLLDKYFEAKIADLGMARHAEKGPSSQVLTHITKKETKTKAYQSTAYLAPENKRGGRPSIKGDTFAFGVILFETCTGEKAYDDRREGDGLLLADYMSDMMDDSPESTWLKLQDTKIVSSCREDIFIRLLQLGSRCTKKKIERPDMVEVFKKLEELENDMRGFESHEAEKVGDTPPIKSDMIDSVRTQQSSMNAHVISFSSDGGYNPGIMTACSEPYTPAQGNLRLGIPSPVQVPSPDLAKSPFEMLPPGYPIPEPIILQMMQDKSLPPGIVRQGDQWLKSLPPGIMRQGDHWVKACDENSDPYNDIPSDSKKLAEMEKFDKATSESFQRSDEHSEFSPKPSLPSPELQCDPKKLEYIQQFDNCISNSNSDIGNQEQQVVEVKQSASESVDPCLKGQDQDGEQSFSMKERRTNFFKNYMLENETSEGDTDDIEIDKNHLPCVDVDSIYVGENKHIPDGSYRRHEGNTEIPDTDEQNLKESAFWHSNKEPTECEETDNDDTEIDDSLPANDLTDGTSNEPVSHDTFRECDETENDSLPLDDLTNEGILPVSDLLEDAESLSISENSHSWKNNLVNMNEMKGPPQSDILTLSNS